MARYIRDFQLQTDPGTVLNIIAKYLAAEGYAYIIYNGENVYKKSHGLLNSSTFLKFSTSGYMLRLEAWVYANVPGLYDGELGLDGVMGIAVKEPLKNRVIHIENIILQHSVGGFTGGSFYQPGPSPAPFAQTGAPPAQNKRQYCTDCGAVIIEGSSFCSYCGKRID